MAGLTLDAVTKSYGAVRVIEDLSLTAEAGELVVFLGPSGCGKSTLLRAIAGLESIDSGAIHIGERRVDHLPPGARGVAMVFQHYALYPHMTVRENMAFGLRNARVSAEEIGRRIEEASTSLEIAPLLDRKPGQLSGGQRQRVAIARATVKEPELFLLDEPLSNLDAALRIRTRLELAQLHKRLNTTMIFVTHDQVEAMTLADRIVVLNGGGIEQIAPPMEVYRRPCTRFVAEFVGSPKINIHSATISPGDDGFANARLECGALLKTGVKMQDFPGQTATLGIRPEHVRICAADTADATGTVMVVERLGERTLVHTRLPDSTLLVAEDAGASEVRMGDTVGLTINGSCAHLFDKDGLGYHAEERPR